MLINLNMIDLIFTTIFVLLSILRFTFSTGTFFCFLQNFFQKYYVTVLDIFIKKTLKSSTTSTTELDVEEVEVLK